MVQDIFTKECGKTRGDNFLTREEARMFIQKILEGMGMPDSFQEQDYTDCINELDQDGNGTIEKDELVMFIKKAMGLVAL